MALITLGLSHHSTPIALRERMAFAEADVPLALGGLRALPGVREAAILSTCNRTELFAVTEGDEDAVLRHWWREIRDAGDAALDQHLYLFRDVACVTHTLRVASGLDSMVLGEPQILGQMKQSFALANEVSSLGPVLSRLFQHAFAVAKHKPILPRFAEDEVDDALQHRRASRAERNRGDEQRQCEQRHCLRPDPQRQRQAEHQADDRHRRDGEADRRQRRSQREVQAGLQAVAPRRIDRR